MNDINKRTYYENLLRDSDALEEAKLIGLSIRSKTEACLDDYITFDPDLVKVKEEIVKLSPTKLPILILGETGTGKELIAKALHGDRKGEFIPVNCAGVPDTLLESEFFGHIKGAFTGALCDKTGLIKEAHNGTLFLDEIGDMPLILQSKLLRVIQSQKFRRVGDAREYPVTCRFIAATNLTKEEIRDPKKFRSDLYYRLAGKIIYLKPLKDRLHKDFVEIVSRFAKSVEIAAYITSTYTQFDFPGNIRELLNLIEATNILFESKDNARKI